MTQDVTGKQASDAMGVLFDGDVKTPSDRILLTVGKVSGALAFGGQPVYLLASDLKAPKALQYTILAVLAVSAILFIITFCLLGIRSAGRSAGKATWLGQTVYVLARVTLYVLLPCAVLAMALIIWAIMTKQPAFR